MGSGYVTREEEPPAARRSLGSPPASHHAATFVELRCSYPDGQHEPVPLVVCRSGERQPRYASGRFPVREGHRPGDEVHASTESQRTPRRYGAPAPLGAQRCMVGGHAPGREAARPAPPPPSSPAHGALAPPHSHDQHDGQRPLTAPPSHPATLLPQWHDERPSGHEGNAAA
ncbi:hypothetical protein CEXT_138571 [Caerostris extrusa]|uniref:Uncharacterized protein n=1 Tax=Caerostris extrusa TaxID=172846 RepID=A0AAV4VQ25_CAEEX|nr:hypothetical protein CEXT_138571 [Caerostris extrusa]